MRKKICMLMMAAALSTSFVGCGKAETKTVENKEPIVYMEETNEAEEAKRNVAEIESTEQEENVYTEYDTYFLLNGVYNEGNQIDLATLNPDGSSYSLIKSIDIYYTNKELAGYTKENIDITVVSSNDEWAFCSLGTNGFLVKKEAFDNAIKEETVKESEAASKQEETDKVESNSASPTPNPVEEAPQSEKTVVMESNKYTPEEAVEIYKNTILAGGITWNPNLVNGASWGTGWIDLNDPEGNAKNELEGLAYEHGDGNPTTQYYFVVTGTDENYVYITAYGG